MSHPRFQALLEAGQSIWLDFIDRRILRDGSLARLIEDGVRGMTSNPTIFEKALAESDAYDAQVGAAPEHLTAHEVFELIETDDVRTACDAFLPIYRASGGDDGYVSIEVSPGVAHDADATVAEARRLWAAVDRPNVMVKVPGTEEGARAVRRLIADGINVNVTLLFAISAHDRVIEAYIAGLEDRAAAGQPVDHVASVASFFVSRVDSEIDKRLAALGGEATALQGRAAIANARLAYRLFTQRFAGERWERLRARGARVQRPLWASTSTKNPAYRDVIYVETLIGPHTVNTMPPATLQAFRDHGESPRTVDQGWDEAEALLATLARHGIPMDAVTDQLLAEGLASFQKSFDSLIGGLAAKRQALGAASA
ncbi:MAG: transaldolase [Gemmatimonadetes bacterium]|nr:transaldolase [Gemmatimonadota bacterium]